MPIELRPIDASDFEALKRCGVVEGAAFAESHTKPIVYPGPFPPGGDGRRAKELSDALTSEPNTRLVAAVDTELEGPDAVVAWGTWVVFAEGMPAPKERQFGPGINVEAAKMMFGGIDGLRKNREGMKCIYLHLLVTDPKHQGRGAGRLLLSRVAEEADQLGLSVFLESSEAGHELYAKVGYQDVEPLEVSLAKFGHERLYRAWGMVRPAKA
ncbi:hypothetical protein ACHAQH_008228 [Verticillium albo-atrum]